MSTNLTPAARLTAIVLSHHGHTQMCALERARDILLDGKLDKYAVCLADVGQMLGFSVTESRGVMSGWDSMTGLKHMSESMRTQHRHDAPEEFDRGYKLGRSLACL